MQDFVRLATGEMGRTLYDKLGLRGAEKFGEVREVLLAEDAARRAHMWSMTPQPPLAFTRLHSAYEAVVNRIWDYWTTGGFVEGLCDRVLRADVSVTWVVGGAVPGYSYGLNRLLAGLVARLLAQRGGRPLTGSGKKPGEPEPECRPVIITGLKLKSLTAAPDDSHLCHANCYTRRHSARLQADLAAPGPGDYVVEYLDLVVVRHGVEQQPFFGQAALSEQITPFSFPA